MPFAADSSSGASFLGYLPIILIFAAMYFFFIRPTTRRRREAQEMQSRIAPGDEVQTIGGMFGTVTAIDDESVTIEASPGVNLRYLRNAIARVVNQPQPEEEPSDEVVDTDPAKTIEQG